MSSIRRIEKLLTKYTTLFLLCCSSIIVVNTSIMSNAWAQKDFFNRLDGYWNGNGMIIFSGGERESLKCRATYFPSDQGRKLRQNIRCASPSYRVTASSDYENKDGDITGQWVETGFELTGNVTGKLKGNTLELFVKGQTFTADMSVTLKNKGCQKLIKIAPKGVQIDLMSLNFRKKC